MEIREISFEEVEEVLALWQSVEGTGLDRDIDNKERIALYLRRNPGLSLAALENGRIVGAVLCGHDGRRGYMHHLSVAGPHRGKGIGRTLVEKAISRLRLLGLRKCHVFVFEQNVDARRFWRSIGWTERTDLVIMSCGITL